MAATQQIHTRRGAVNFGDKVQNADSHTRIGAVDDTTVAAGGAEPFIELRNIFTNTLLRM